MCQFYELPVVSKVVFLLLTKMSRLPWLQYFRLVDYLFYYPTNIFESLARVHDIHAKVCNLILAFRQLAKTVGGSIICCMGRIQFNHSYETIISIDNLLEAWKEFSADKDTREDVAKFRLQLMGHLLQLHDDLKDGKFTHGPYMPFKINDPKPRDIHKATVRDRILHRALYRKLYPFFDRTFISDSYSCRIDKGTHRAFKRFNRFARQASRNHTETVWILKCDIRKFFASIDHEILSSILNLYIPDQDILRLLNQIINSFHSSDFNVGMPLGNLTSQLFANICMNEFDQFMKHEIKAKYYIRYADDFVILNTNRKWLESILVKMSSFLKEKLHLSLHPNKTFIKTFASGVDFLGWIHFPNHRVLRTSTRRRMMNRCGGEPKLETVSSYLGMLKHGNAYKYQEILQPIHDRLLEEFLRLS